MFNRQGTALTNLRTDGMIQAGDPVYRIVESEEWSIVFPVTDRQTVRLAANNKLMVKF